MTDILSDDDMDEIIVRELGLEWDDDTTHEFARAVERAVLSRLAAMGGELPPSTKHVTSWDGDSCDRVPIYAYTADQLRTERAKGLLAGIAQERARCVAVCDGLAEQGAEQYPLPDDMYDSKDWRAGSYAERVEWLHTMYENSQKTLDTYLAMRPSAEPSAWATLVDDRVQDVSLTKLAADLRAANLCEQNRGRDFVVRVTPLYAHPAPVLPAEVSSEPLSVHALASALVASRIIDADAVSNPDGYDDGVTLSRVAALHRRLTPPAPGCIDPLCPCQDGALCHYVDGPDGTMALPAPSAEPTVPVAWMSPDGRVMAAADRAGWLAGGPTVGRDVAMLYDTPLYDTPLYAHPAPAEPAAVVLKGALDTLAEYGCSDTRLYKPGDAPDQEWSVPLYAHPAPAAPPAPITDEMVEAACEAHTREWAEIDGSKYDAADIDDDARSSMRAALRAALGVGQP